MQVTVTKTDTSVSVRGIVAQNFDHARLLALKHAGLHVDPTVAVADVGQKPTIGSADRKHFGRITRTHIDRDGSYRIKVARR